MPTPRPVAALGSLGPRRPRRLRRHQLRRPSASLVPPGATFAAVTDTPGRPRGHRQPRVVQAPRPGPRRGPLGAGGVYEFPPGTSPWKVLDVLAQGRGGLAKFTVPEGLTIPEVAALAAERLGIPADSCSPPPGTARPPAPLLGYPVAVVRGLPPARDLLAAARHHARDELVRIMAEGFKADWSRPGPRGSTPSG